MLQVYILALAVLTPQGWELYHYREDGVTTTIFPTKKACEKVKEVQSKAVDKMAEGTPYVLNCVPKDLPKSPI